MNNGTVQPLTEEEQDCIFFEDAGDPTVASVDTLSGAVTGLRLGYAAVTVDSCGSGPPLTVHIYVDSNIDEEPERETGPVLHELRIETQEDPVLLRPGDSEPVSIWAVDQNGQEVLLQPEEDEVEFTTGRIQVRQDEAAWSLTYPDRQATEDAFNERINVVHQGAAAQRTVLLRPRTDPTPKVDEQCRYPAVGTTTLVTADTVAVHMDRRTRTEREAERTAEALQARVIGRSTHQDWKERSQYLLKFVCETDADLQAFHQRARAHERVLNLRHHPESPGGSSIWELDAGPDVTIEQGASHKLEVRAHLFDGTIRPVPEDEKSKVKAASLDDKIITAGEGHEIQALRTGRTAIEVQYEDLSDWATVTVLPAQIDDQCVARTVLVGHRTIIQAQDLTEISFTLQKDHGRPTASELATALGRTISEETSGLEAAPAWLAHREMYCRNGAAPEGPGTRELRTQLSDLRADPRVWDASFTTSHTTLDLTQGTALATPVDFGWDPEPPAGGELEGLVVPTIAAERIYRLRFLVAGDYGNDVVAPLSPETADSLTVTSLTGTTLLVGAGDVITALRPGNGRLRFEVTGHRKTVGITVREDLIKGPDLATGCMTDVGGTMVAHDQAAITGDYDGGRVQYGGGKGGRNGLGRGCKMEQPGRERPPSGAGLPFVRRRDGVGGVAGQPVRRGGRRPPARPGVEEMGRLTHEVTTQTITPPNHPKGKPDDTFPTRRGQDRENRRHDTCHPEKRIARHLRLRPHRGRTQDRPRRRPIFPCLHSLRRRQQPTGPSLDHDPPRKAMGNLSRYGLPRHSHQFIYPKARMEKPAKGDEVMQIGP